MQHDRIAQHQCQYGAREQRLCAITSTRYLESRWILYFSSGRSTPDGADLRFRTLWLCWILYFSSRKSTPDGANQSCAEHAWYQFLRNAMTLWQRHFVRQHSLRSFTTLLLGVNGCTLQMTSALPTMFLSQCDESENHEIPLILVDPRRYAYTFI